LRPDILFPLFAPINSLPGVGPRIAQHIEKIAGPHIVDLIWHLPREIIDRRYNPSVVDAKSGRIATLRVHVKSHVPSPRRGLPYRVRCEDDTGTVSLVFFHSREEYLIRLLPVGEERIVSGRVERYRGEVQITHPDHILAPDQIDELKSVEPVYPMTEGLSPKTLVKTIEAACEKAPEFAEWLDPSYLKRQRWPAWRNALLSAHAPESETELEPLAQARARLAYDELLANQLALALVRERLKGQPGRTLKGDGGLRREVLSNLPYTLTGSQKIALREISGDMASTNRMLRLLQGDVGSGKTIVALFAMLEAVECGTQAAIMAPTEILARQHFATIEALASGQSVAILTGRNKGAKRKQILADLENGSIDIVVGTHALFQESVAFHDLGIAVIDEQHRFGVYQRLSLQAKGRGVDILVMTATPIPRSLMLTAYGDLDASLLMEKPAGRKPVDTRIVSLQRLDEVIAAVGREVKNGAKVFWVCPLVEESEVSDLAAAEERHADLKSRFGEGVELIHGRMKGPQKDAAMEQFVYGSANIMVATTVIEVGVDVADATLMIIEHAERFGLAQLHQLRGRVGRGDRRSTCLLLYAPPLGANARARLSILRETEDGFRIAEEDLQLRGAGELLGTKQSGLPEFRLADITAHRELLAAARDDARLIVERDAELQSDRGKALRNLLYLFERDAAVANFRSG
jgi:ATP-dependent DNA helicase RecG